MLATRELVCLKVCYCTAIFELIFMSLTLISTLAGVASR